MSASTIKVLETGLQYIQKYGWKQGSYGRKEVGFCALGAVREASYDLNDKFTFMHERSDKYYTAIGDLEKCAGEPVANYNDTLSRKKADIIKLFECAIERAKARSERARAVAARRKSNA